MSDAWLTPGGAFLLHTKQGNNQADRIRCFRQKHSVPVLIVGGGREGEGPSNPVAATELRLVLPRNGLDPAERLLDPLADAQADGIAGMPRRACDDS